jgi:PAS domain S-box-containing protein
MTAPLSATEYRLLIEHSPVMIWRAGLDAKCDYFNETWLAFTGRTLEQESGDGWADGVHPDDFQRCVEYYLDHFKRRAAFEMEYRLRRHDGVFRWIFDRGVPYTDDRGEFAGFIGSCVDVEERRRSEEAKAAHDQQELALAREFEQSVLSIVSHDIRNPLGAISMASELIAMRAQSDPELASLAGRLGRSVERITNIVNDLLDVSRERDGKGIPVNLAPTDLAVVCREVADEIRSFVKDRPIEVAAAGEAKGLWDGNRISQALSNLVGNAVKHGAPGTPIALRVRTESDHAIVEVHNHGSIAPEVLPTLFRPFAGRSDPTRIREAQGLGLGLFIARSIARAHRGDLVAESSAEHGTTFSLRLPRDHHIRL